MIGFASPIYLSGRLQTILSCLILVLMVIAIGTALGFEHIGGYMPCKLCLEERIPYYAGIPLMIITLALSLTGKPGFIIRLLFLITAFLMVYNLGLSIYHAGAEYKFWPGPTDCSAAATAITSDANDLLANLNRKRPPSCDTAAGYFLGLSFAGWNAVASLFLALLALVGTFCAFKKNGEH